MRAEPADANTVTLTSLAAENRRAPWLLSLLHADPRPRMIWITHGQARLILGPRRHGISAQTCLFVPALQPFALIAGAGLTGHLIQCPQDVGTPWPFAPHILRLSDTAVQHTLATHVDALMRERSQSQSDHDAAAHLHAGLLAIWWRRQTLSADETAAPSSASDRLIAAFLEELERMYHQGLSASDFGARLDVTPEHLGRVCKTGLGMTAAALVTQRRLHAARVAIETSATPLKDIARHLGFRAPAYFSSFVQKHTGHAPRELRKRALR